MNSQIQPLSLADVLSVQKRAYLKQPMPNLQQRKTTLQRLKQSILDHQDALADALMEDFGCRSREETSLAEIMPSIQAINYSLKNLKKWMKPSRRHVALQFQPAKARVEYQPLGVVGIIVPWNYPVFLTLGPLITALAAGNRAMIKLSEFTPATNSVLIKMMEQLFELDEVYVATGGADVAAAFSSLPFDHLLFTGSTAVGKMVMKAASENLTPVTLELGGKSPALLTDGIKFSEIADRLLFGKSLNAGQTCVAPDYILCPEDQQEELMTALKTCYQRFYPSLKHCDQSTSIINHHHYARLRGLLDEAVEQGATVVNMGHESIQQLESEKKIPLQLVFNVTDQMRLMQEELFGPILPVVTYRVLDEAIDYIQQHSRPLALYLFSYDREIQQRVLAETHAGGVCINESVFHVGQDDLPFGGIGQSGMGHYHGHEGFLTLSHAKAVYEKGRINSARLIYPPYRGKILSLLNRLFLR